MRDVLVAGVIAGAGRVSSRVKLQKVIYLLQRMGFDLGFYDFALRDFGPFSAELAATIDAVSSGEDNMVTETSGELGTDAAGRPITQYSYEAKRELAPTLEQHIGFRFPGHEVVFAHLAKELSDQSRSVLEVAATAVYLRDEVGIKDEAQLWAEVDRRKGQRREHFDDAKALLLEWDTRRLLHRA